ncbi:hypothetical protein RFI_09028, partial [Reticulomyxa filosa]
RQVSDLTRAIEQLKSEMNESIVQFKRQQIEEKSNAKNCEDMLLFIDTPALRNGVDFLLISENNQTIELKNREWNSYNFGVFLVGEHITLTVNCSRKSKREELGHLKIKTSHLWIKQSSSKIDCSQLGHPRDSGSGKGGYGASDTVCGGGGYGTKGEGEKGGDVCGEDTLLKEIHFGSGGGGWFGGGDGGGIIELVIGQQLTNHGSIQANGGNGCDRGGGGGSGGSILIELQCQSKSDSITLGQSFGTITCIGGNQHQINAGGKGRIAIYGFELSSDDIKNIDPKPFNRIYK